VRNESDTKRQGRKLFKDEEEGMRNQHRLSECAVMSTQQQKMDNRKLKD